MEQEGLIAIHPKVLKVQIQKFNPVVNRLWKSVKEFEQFIDSNEDIYAKTVQKF